MDLIVFWNLIQDLLVQLEKASDGADTVYSALKLNNKVRLMTLACY